MKSTKAKVFELEAELLRLNDMVRARRRQLEKLEQCPHKECECRSVWREIVEKDLASQVGKIRTTVNHNGKKAGSPKTERAKKR